MSNLTLTPAPAGAPVLEADAASPPSSAASAASAASEPSPAPVLSWRLDRVEASFAGAPPVPVRIVLANPITDPQGMIAFIDEKKRCLLELPSLAALPEPSRGIAALELERRYCIAVVIRVESTLVDFGNRYWRVVTDRGRRSFMLRDLNRNLTRLPPDQLLIRDTAGNRYCIPSLAALDAASRLAAERAL